MVEKVSNESKKRSNYADEMDFINQKLEKFQNTMIEDIVNRVGAVFDEIMQEFRQRELHAIADTDVTNSNSLRVKIFIARESYLTALLKVDHMRSVYNIFRAFFIFVCLHTITYDYFVDGNINFGFSTMKIGFARIHYVLGICLVQHAFVFLLYYAFKTWIHIRIKIQSKSALQRFWSQCCVILYIVSQIAFGYAACALCLKLNLPYASEHVLLLETIRLLMKMHAFVRTNASRVLADKQKVDDSINCNDVKGSKMLAPFAWYVYFLFAPTLLYRDSYPRTSTIRWKFALDRFLEVLAIAFLYCFLHERYMKVHFVDFGREPISVVDLIVKLYAMLVPSTIALLCLFYLLLHAWLNFTAEILRFGDRMFYMDWWTCFNYAAYYRKWNAVVHDWLYEYIYKDCLKYLFCGSKLASSFMVFTVSALAHEVAIGFALQLFFPVEYIFFGVLGFWLKFATKKFPKNLGNIFLWFSLISGKSLIISLYYMEYYTLQNCKMANNDFIDYLLPGIWKCRSRVMK